MLQRRWSALVLLTGIGALIFWPWLEEVARKVPRIRSLRSASSADEAVARVLAEVRPSLSDNPTTTNPSVDDRGVEFVVLEGDDPVARIAVFQLGEEWFVSRLAACDSAAT